MEFIVGIVGFLNSVMSAVFGVLLAPVAMMPGWLSITIISVMVGPLLLLIFKYTSNQKAIKRVGDEIKANMLVLKLYKDSVSVTLEAQGKIFKGLFFKLSHALMPMVVMMVPVTLLLGQMSLWYQARPLQNGDESLVTVTVRGEVGDDLPDVSIKSIDGGEIAMERSKFEGGRQFCWMIRGTDGSDKAGRIVFDVAGQEVVKEFAVGDSFMRVSAVRPGQEDWAGQLMHPWEKPFDADSMVKSISIEYPERGGLVSGTKGWLIYFFIASMAGGFVFMPVFKVKI